MTHPPPVAVPPGSERVRSNEVIVTGDGIELVADLYVPGGRPPFPAVFEITPYGARDLARLGEIYAARGYLFLAVDARGRYRSGGQWEPVVHDQSDGHAVVRWLAAHEMCSGRVGSRGHSYSGYNQLLCAIDAPAALQAMVVCVAPGDPFDNVPLQGGAYDINDLMWLLGMSGRVCADGGEAEELGIKRFGAESLESNPYQPSEAERLAAQQERLRAEAQRAVADAALAGAPFGEVDLRFGVRHEVFREWIGHWRLDDYWQARSAIRRLGRSAVPTLHVSGWWDVNGRGATSAYRAMRGAAASAAAREAQRLLMGPWNHDLKAPDCSALPRDEAEQIERAALHDELNDEFAWIDWRLKDLEPGPSTRARVRLFVTGLYRWLEFDDWPPASTRAQAFFLAGGAVPRRGTLTTAPPENGASESGYLFDPEQPTPYAEARVGGERAPFDNSALERSRADMLLFDTAPLAAPLALIGEPELRLHASADAPDFDLCAKLLDVHPDGRAIYLGDGVVRARFRGGWERPQPALPGEAAEYRIDLWHIAHVVRAGHSLRLEVSSAAFRRFDVNPCTGGDPAHETATRSARIRVLHSAQRVSRLLLPVCGDSRLAGGDVA